VGEAKVTYRVLWDEVALAELDEIWKSTQDREGLQHVVTRTNIELTHNPLEAGESREQQQRVLFKFPLVIWFRALERIREVQVLHVKLVKR
jgi:hypothetical protein